MKLRVFAVIAAIATISFAAPVKADTAIASLQLEPQVAQESLSCNATKSQTSQLLAFAIAPSTCESWNLTKESNSNLKLTVLASEIVYDLVPSSGQDRVVMLSQKDHIACLVDGNGSSHGSVTCGFVDVD
jgi:hypothetical protein